MFFLVWQQLIQEHLMLGLLIHGALFLMSMITAGCYGVSWAGTCTLGYTTCIWLQLVYIELREWQIGPSRTMGLKISWVLEYHFLAAMYVSQSWSYLKSVSLSGLFFKVHVEKFWSLSHCKKRIKMSWAHKEKMLVSASCNALHLPFTTPNWVAWLLFLFLLWCLQ